MKPAKKSKLVKRHSGTLGRGKQSLTLESLRRSRKFTMPKPDKYGYY